MMNEKEAKEAVSEYM
jgi:26S proteasome regulatory subunit, ATPase 3, interacting protein